MNHTKHNEGMPPKEKSDSAIRMLGVPWLILALPLVLIGLIMAFAPNFNSTDRIRTSPMGGDFLQEWVGAKIFEIGEEDKLYDLAYVQAVQHDAALVGFEWSEEEYFPMVYPPFYFASLQPISKFRYPVASRIWATLSALALSISGLLLYLFYPPCRRVWVICFVAALFFVPLLNCFNMGQKSTFLLLILSGTFVLLHNKRPFLAGLVFGLIIFKPHLGIVIGLTMLLKGQWKFSLGALTIACTAFGYSWLSHGQLVIDYARVISEMRDYVETGGYLRFDSHSFWGATQLTFGWLPANVVKTIAAVLSLVVVGLLWRIMQGKLEPDSSRFARQFAAMVFAMVLLSPHFYGYDLTILLLPMLLIVSSLPPGTWRSDVVDGSLGFVLLGIFVLGGLFSQIAAMIAIQPSIFLLVAAMTLLGIRRPIAVSTAAHE